MIADLAPEYGAKRITDEAWQALASYTWPGNVRELRQAVARAVALGGDELRARDFFPDLGLGRRRTLEATPPPPLLPEDDPSLAPYETMLRGAMAQALQRHGSIRAAATSIGMPKSTFADKARTWNLSARRRPKYPSSKK